MSEPFTLYDVATGEAFTCASPYWAEEQVEAGRYSYEPVAQEAVAQEAVTDADAETDEPEPEEVAGAADDLTAIKGIGDAFAVSLAALGIRTYAQLVAAETDTLAALLETSESRVKEWQAQAADLAE